jgi:hypothetical protein
MTAACMLYNDQRIFEGLKGHVNETAFLIFLVKVRHRSLTKLLNLLDFGVKFVETYLIENRFSVINDKRSCRLPILAMRRVAC